MTNPLDTLRDHAQEALCSGTCKEKHAQYGHSYTCPMRYYDELRQQVEQAHHDAMYCNTQQEVAEARVDLLTEALRLALDALEKHEKWCGFNVNAPGDPSFNLARNKADRALSPSPEEPKPYGPDKSCGGWCDRCGHHDHMHADPSNRERCYCGCPPLSDSSQFQDTD